MKATFIIADSGGTSTKWAIGLTDSDSILIETPSLHPRNLKDKELLKNELRSLFSEFDAPLYFYGAGCGSEGNRQVLSSFLTEVGFKQVEVYSDIFGACRALCGKQSGVVAILGTGSIGVNFNGTEITGRFGGFGPIIGDEGSGFYFGKLLVRYALEKSSWNPELEALFGTPDKLRQQIAGPNSIQFIAGLAGSVHVSNLDFLHKANIQAFVHSYLSDIPENTEIHFLGSYAFYQKEILREVLNGQGLKLGQCVQNPIQGLVHYHNENLL